MSNIFTRREETKNYTVALLLFESILSHCTWSQIQCQCWSDAEVNERIRLMKRSYCWRNFGAFVKTKFFSGEIFFVTYNIYYLCTETSDFWWAHTATQYTRKDSEKIYIENFRSSVYFLVLAYSRKSRCLLVICFLFNYLEINCAHLTRTLRTR